MHFKFKFLNNILRSLVNIQLIIWKNRHGNETKAINSFET